MSAGLELRSIPVSRSQVALFSFNGNWSHDPQPFFSAFIVFFSFFTFQALACFSVAIAISFILLGLTFLVLVNLYPQLAFQAGLVCTTLLSFIEALSATRILFVPYSIPNILKQSHSSIKQKCLASSQSLVRPL